jgi:glycosyltransferase involved in cell wall biosynthesis
VRVTGVAQSTDDAQPISVLMVTGAYYPELSGGGIQARTIISALRHRARFSVLTTTTARSLATRSDDDGVQVRRVFVDVRRSGSEVWAALKLFLAFVSVAPGVDVVNLHGFSRKAILFAALSRVFGKAFVLTLQTGVHDEPATARVMGRLAYWAYTHADLYLSVSPGLSRAYLEAGLPASRLRQLCNAVDVERFRPAEPGERMALRAELGLPSQGPIVLFVGFFSREKRPDFLYDAWSRIAAARSPSALVFIGATQSSYGEIDATLAADIRDRAAEDGFENRIYFVESTLVIEKYYRAVDVYVLPSVREGLPIALLEAMASGLPCVASRLPGSTDGMIIHGVNGLLAAPEDRDGFIESIRSLLDDVEAADRLGSAARAAVVERYSIQRTAPLWLAGYEEAARAASRPRTERCR